MEQSEISNNQEESGFKILLFGSNLVGNESLDLPKKENYEIDIISYPDKYNNLTHLSDYNLVIMDHGAFLIGGSIYSEHQNIIDKQIMDALDKGTTICFTYYNDSSFDEAAAYQKQIGFRWLNRNNIKFKHSGKLNIDLKVHKEEFRNFFNKWGATYNSFIFDKDSKVDDEIYGDDNLSLSFSINYKKGNIIYIPFQRDFQRKENLIKGIETLIDAISTYLTKIYIDLPDWASKPFFEEEFPLKSKVEKLEKELSELNSELEKYSEAKTLICKREYELENSVPTFITGRMNIPTYRDEKYKEDFWIVDEKGNKIVICEIKSMIKGFRKSSIYKICSHRDEYGLSDNFPTLLIVNHHLQAKSWKTKDKLIDKQDFKFAFENNVLLLRIEDLVRLWHSYQKSKIKKEQIISLLTNENGWLSVNQDLNYSILPKT